MSNRQLTLLWFVLAAIILTSVMAGLWIIVPLAIDDATGGVQEVFSAIGRFFLFFLLLLCIAYLLLLVPIGIFVQPVFDLWLSRKDNGLNDLQPGGAFWERWRYERGRAARRRWKGWHKGGVATLALFIVGSLFIMSIEAAGGSARGHITLWPAFAWGSAGLFYQFYNTFFGDTRSGCEKVKAWFDSGKAYVILLIGPCILAAFASRIWTYSNLRLLIAGVLYLLWLVQGAVFLKWLAWQEELAEQFDAEGEGMYDRIYRDDPCDKDNR